MPPKSGLRWSMSVRLNSSNKFIVIYLFPQRIVFFSWIVYVHKELCLFYKMLYLFLNSCKFSSYIFSEYIGVTLFINRVAPLSFFVVLELVIFYDFESLICISQERERNTSYVRWARRLFACAFSVCRWLLYLER